MASPLTEQEILDAAEAELRRFGPTKTNVVDVARALGVSHGTVYRHFASKSALRGAVAERWLRRVSDPLAKVAAAPDPAAARLTSWVRELVRVKQQMAATDPELFATLVGLASTSPEVLEGHVRILEQQLAGIVADGVERGEFRPVDPDRAGRAVLQATARFHHPALAAEWANSSGEDDLSEVLDLVLRGLIAPSDG